MTHVAAVIPFYQRTPGLLATAVRSILAQRLPADVRVSIIVVDDASPRPADEDLREVGLTAPHRLTVLRQDNAGPGAARNRGLDSAVAAGADFIGFLDSDDRWRPDHLAHALAALADDADLFFDDHVRVQYPDSSHLTTNGRLERWRTAGTIVPLDGATYAIRGRDILRPFMEDYLAQTSTLVYRLHAAPDLRFDPSLRILGEDLLFVLGIASAARGIRLSSAIGVDCDEGVSMFHSTLSWDHPDAPMRFAASLLFWNRVRETMTLSARDNRFVDEKIAGFRRGFAYIWLRAAARTRRPHEASMALLRTHLHWRASSLIPALAQVVARRLTGREAFPEH